MKLSIFFLFFISTYLAIGQNLKAHDGTQMAKKIAANSTTLERNEKLVQLVKEKSAKDFTNQEEYVGFLTSFQELIIKSEPKEADLCFEIGVRLYTLKFHLEAFPFLHRVGEIIEHSTKKFEFECSFHETIAGAYYFFGRYEEAENAYMNGLKCENTTPASKINIYNTLGLINGEDKNYIEAEKNFRKALKIAEENKKEAWKGVITGNLGYIYYLLDDHAKAKEYLKKDFNSSVLNNELGSAISAKSLLIEIDLKENNIAAARIKVATLDSLVAANENSGSNSSYFSAKTAYLEKIGDYKNALFYYRKFIKMQDSVALKRNLVNFNNTEFQIQFEKTQSEIKLLEEKQRTDNTRINSLYIIALVILLGAIVIIWQIVKRRKREKEILELKNQRMQDNLERAKLELKDVLNNLIEKNQTVANLSEELQAIHDSQNDQSELEKIEINEKLHSFTLLTDEDWLNFKRLFEKLHPGFFEYFQNNYEEITNAEVRLAALIKLNLENLEMSNALGISPDSVRKTNLRLRKRLDITEQKDLQKLIFSIS